MESALQHNPRSKVLDGDYIHIYSTLTPQERRQLSYKRRYKKERPQWDDATIRACAAFQVSCDQRRGDLTVLDAGCGNGNYLIDEFRSRISWAAGVDASSDATQGNICCDEVKIAPLDALPYPDNHFDCVLSLWVVEHLEKPEAVFRELYRVLKPGGMLLFLTPNVDAALLRVKRLLKRTYALTLNRRMYGREEEDVFPTYYKANTLSALQKMLRSAGFQDSTLSLNDDPSYLAFSSFTY